MSFDCRLMSDFLRSGSATIGTFLSIAFSCNVACTFVVVGCIRCLTRNQTTLLCRRSLSFIDSRALVLTSTINHEGKRFNIKTDKNHIVSFSTRFSFLFHSLFALVFCLPVVFPSFLPSFCIMLSYRSNHQPFSVYFILLQTKQNRNATKRKIV